MIETHRGNPFSIMFHDTARDLQLVLKFRALTKFVAEVLARRRQERRRETDFLSSYVDAYDKNTGEGMEEKALIDEIMTLIVAGHETTASTMNWTWYLLSQHPEVEEKLQRELSRLSTDGPPRFEDLPQLSYNAFTLRCGYSLARRSQKTDLGIMTLRQGLISSCHLTSCIDIPIIGASQKRLGPNALGTKQSGRVIGMCICPFQWACGAVSENFLARSNCRFTLG